MPGGRPLNLRWNNMRASTDLVGPSSKVEMAQLRQLITHNEAAVLGRLSGDKNIPRERVIDSLVENVGIRISKGNALAQTVTDEKSGILVGIAIAEKAAWDSEHFDRKMGKISLAVFDSTVGQEQRLAAFGAIAKKAELNMISARVNLNDLCTIHALERLGAILTDILLTFRFDLAVHIPSPHFPKMKVSPAEEMEAEELGLLGGRIFQVDRFHGDPNLPSSKSDELYSKWVSNCVNGLADTVLVARDNDRIAGFITCKIERIGPDCKVGVVDLVGVDPSYGGRGVGSDLISAALRWFSGKARSVYVGTQAANLRAVRLYERSRFIHASSEATLHLWSDSGA